MPFKNTLSDFFEKCLILCPYATTSILIGKKPDSAISNERTDNVASGEAFPIH